MVNKYNLDMVYFESITKELHVDNKYKKSFSDIVAKDSPGKNFGFSQRILDTLCIDTDDIETNLSGNNDNTMDLVIGIAQYNDTQQTYQNSRFLPVELKLNCKSFNGIKKKDLLKKDKHTRNLINGYSVTTDSHSVFLFPQNVASAAENNKSRWDKEPGSDDLKNWIMMSPEKYNTYIHFAEDYPYKPVTNINDLKAKISQLLSKSDYYKLINFIENIMKKAEDYKRKYNINECNAIVDFLNDAINPLIGKTGDTDIDDYLSMLNVDINALKKI